MALDLSRFNALLQRPRAVFGRVHEYLQSKPRAFWLWLGGVVITVEICLFCIYRIFFVLPEQLGQDAFYHNRRVSVDIDSGEVVGGLHSQSAVLGAQGAESSRANRSLNVAPYDIINESSAFGPLPKISGSVLPWQYYSKSFAPVTGYPKVAVILTDLGLHQSDIDAALHLPPQITFSLSPYASHTQEVSERLRALGYETMTDIPLQPSDYPYSDPGPYAVLAGNEDIVNHNALYQALSRFSGYTGGVVSQDEVLTGSDRGQALVDEFTRRGIMFLYTKNDRNERWSALPFSNAWMALTADIRIDETLDAAQIKERFNKLEALAKKQFAAVAIIRPFPASLQALQDWLATFDKEHLELVPLSNIARQRYHVYALPEPEPEPAKKSEGGHEGGEGGEGEHKAEEKPAEGGHEESHEGGGHE